jgi:hypothetical protein
MIRFITAILTVGLALAGVWAQEPEPEQPQILFIAENEAGKVWVNTSLTLQRTSEPYLPMVVAVQNLQQKNVELDRSSIWLTDLDDVIYVMPTVKEFRKNYKKTSIDYRMVSYGGIPWEGWRWNRQLESSNFFPDLRASRGNTTRDRVTLRKRHAIVNLLYFERPRRLQPNKPFFLVVRADGWEEPIRLRLVLS